MADTEVEMLLPGQLNSSWRMCGINYGMNQYRRLTWFSCTEVDIDFCGNKFPHQVIVAEHNGSLGILDPDFLEPN